MSEVREKLQRARAVAWSSLIPAFDQALLVAEQIELQAAMEAEVFEKHVEPKYPPIILLLAASTPSMEGQP